MTVSREKAKHIYEGGMFGPASSLEYDMADTILTLLLITLFRIAWWLIRQTFFSLGLALEGLAIILTWVIPDPVWLRLRYGKERAQQIKESRYSASLTSGG